MRGGPARHEIALPREHISDLIVIPLNDEVVEGVETAEAWPPREGLPPGEDPFDEKALVPAPEFLPPGAVVRRDSRRINTERAFALSVILHLLLVIALLTVKLPARTAAQDAMDPLGLQTLMRAPPPDPAIPIQFFPAPGARAKEAPKTGLSVGHEPAGARRGPRPPGDAGAEGVSAVGHSRPRGRKGRGPRAAAAPAAPRARRARGRSSRTSRPAVCSTTRRLPKSGAPGGGCSAFPAPTSSAITAESARRAAQSGGGGEDGGGFEREGGFVDSGPLSFDTVGYDWGAYAAEMIRKIKRNWDVPGSRALRREGPDHDPLFTS